MDIGVDRTVLWTRTKLRPLGVVRDLTIHCTATAENHRFTAEQITAMDVGRFQQPSYHIVVELDGTAVRTLSDYTLGAHVGGHNTGNVGISYVGGIGADGKPKDTRTQAQQATLRRLVNEYKAKYPGITVRGHRDWSPDLNHDGKIEPHEWLKSCPCFDVATQL